MAGPRQTHSNQRWAQSNHGKDQLQKESAPVEQSVARAIQLYNSGKYTSIRAAAERQDIPFYTLYRRLKDGQKPRQQADELNVIVGSAEEKRIVKRIEEMDSRGLLLSVDMVQDRAVKVLKERGGNEMRLSVVGKHSSWISRFLNRHPHLATKFSTQVKQQRIMSSNPKILKRAFNVLL